MLAPASIFLTLLAVVLAEVPHFTKSVYDSKGREITPWMRKHNLTHESGWGILAGQPNAIADIIGVEHCGRLQGLFVMPCTELQAVDGEPVSMVQTRHYHTDDNTYEIDTTYYVGDPNCSPKASDVFYKTYLRGKAQFYGDNKVVKGATRASLNWTDGSYLFGDNLLGRAAVKALNAHCSCGGRWAVGKMRDVKESECEQPIDPKIDPRFKSLCEIISGSVDYFNYDYTKDCQHYITSSDCFEDSSACWNNPLRPGWIREKIAESGNNDPDTCDYELWSQCGKDIQAAHDVCNTCVGLECDGCLFRELNPDWDPRKPGHDTNQWYQCCPCIYRYAEKYDKDWMATFC